MGSLGEDLLLIAIGPRRGRIRHVDRIRFALHAAELLELARAGKVVVAPGRARITRTDATPTGDRYLDQALNRLGQSLSPPTLGSWLRATPRGFVNEYLSRLEADQAIHVERRRPGTASTAPRIGRVDVARRASIKKRVQSAIDDPAHADPTDLTLATLIHACGIGSRLFPGPVGLLARRRLATRIHRSPDAAAQPAEPARHLEPTELTARVWADLRAGGAAGRRGGKESLDYAPGRFETNVPDSGGY